MEHEEYEPARRAASSAKKKPDLAGRAFSVRSWTNE
jgi:hypothetical protein